MIGPPMGQTRVDLLHLLEDLRDAYPGSVEDTILTEVVANSLDSGARRISVRADPADAVLVVVDDGSGMTRRELGRYHDIAASTKQRGRGIGFAGVGIKLGLLVSQDVLTETRRGAVHAATRWRLAAKTRAPWHWVDPPGFVEGSHGTGVCLKLRNTLSPLLDAGFLEAALRRHFQPLLDEAFRAILAERYPQGVELRVNGRTLAPDPALPSRVRIAVRLPRSRRPAAVGFLERGTAPVDDESRGVAVSTLGKVIRRGWDWLGLGAAAPTDVSGLIEAPGLAESLTLNKGDFLRSGPRGFVYLGFRRAIQQAVAAQLAAWGSAPGTDDRAQRRIARPVEKDLETVLVDLAAEFPALSALVDRRPGGQRKLPSGAAADGPLAGAMAAVAPTATSADEPAASPPAGESAAGEATAPEPAEPGPAAATGPEPEEPEPSTAPVILPAPARGPRTPARYGLSIHFKEQPESGELAHLVETQVIVNTAHPAWRRASASRSEGYHIALSVAMALAPLAAEARGTHEFVTTFLARWGKALGRDGRRRGARPNGRRQRA
jgi:hypothetical protein